MTFLPKLVRDKIPKIIKENNQIPIYKVASELEVEFYLKQKLKEEIEEFFEAKNIEEIADVFEVLNSLIKYYQISQNEIVKYQELKNKKNGSFDKKYILLEVKGLS